jgi:hypothetical protein
MKNRLFGRVIQFAGESSWHHYSVPGEKLSDPSPV